MSPNRGESFEQAVAALQQMLDPAASVEHNVRLRDRLGHLRQFDVVLRGKLGGHDALGVIECKDFKRRVGTPEVNAFADKARNVRANLTLLASKSGFTAEALELAAHHGIGTISLLRTDPSAPGFTVGVETFGLRYEWREAKVTLHMLDALSHSSGFTGADVAIRGQRVDEWLIRVVNTSLRDLKTPGWFDLWVRFRVPEVAIVGTSEIRVESLQLSIRRVRETLRRQVQWSGQALYNWSRGEVVVPPNAELFTDGWRSDFSDWEVVDDDPPPMGGRFLFEFRPVVFIGQRNLPKLVFEFRDVADVVLVEAAT